MMNYGYGYNQPPYMTSMTSGQQMPYQQMAFSQNNQQSQQQAGPDWIMAPSIQQVEQVSVQPGKKAWIMVQNEPVFALRTADQMGLITTDYYRFEKIQPNAAAAPSQDYITRQEFDAFVRSLNQNGLNNPEIAKKGDEK